MLRKDVMIDRPKRWDVPFGPTVDPSQLARLLVVSPFSEMDPDRFLPSCSLPDILRNDCRINRYQAGDLIVREGDYGNRVGVYRMMEVMQRYEVRGTVALNSDLCDAHPQVIEDTRALGWEFMGHGKTNTHRQTESPPQTERQHVMDIFERIERATGTRPKGWLGPGLQETWNTLDYLIEAGCEYVADWVNDDQPYWMEIGGKRLVSIPYSFEVNDSVSIVRNKNSPLEFERIIRDQFDVMYREGESSGRVFAISLHPYIIGQPHRIGALDRALDYICGHAGVWKATGSEIVRYCVETGQVLD